MRHHGPGLHVRPGGPWSLSTLMIMLAGSEDAPSRVKSLQKAKYPVIINLSDSKEHDPGGSAMGQSSRLETALVRVGSLIRLVCSV